MKLITKLSCFYPDLPLLICYFLEDKIPSNGSNAPEFGIKMSDFYPAGVFRHNQMFLI